VKRQLGVIAAAAIVVAHNVVLVPTRPETPLPTGRDGEPVS
jgi:hypothetical protein